MRFYMRNEEELYADLLNNCVKPKVGLHVFKEATKQSQQILCGGAKGTKHESSNLL